MVTHTERDFILCDNCNYHKAEIEHKNEIEHQMMCPRCGYSYIVAKIRDSIDFENDKGRYLFKVNDQPMGFINILDYNGQQIFSVAFGVKECKEVIQFIISDNQLNRKGNKIFRTYFNIKENRIINQPFNQFVEQYGH